MEITDWYIGKYKITNKVIATAGSCFAQHIGRHLYKNGFRYLDTEPPPSFMKRERHNDFGYGIYSARYGNIYTAKQLLQLFDRAHGEYVPEELYWEKDGGYVDPFRPTIEPKPFVDKDELDAQRNYHLSFVREIFTKAHIFVFTLGLTEGWVNKNDGAVYPVAPGVSGGSYDPKKYFFKNFRFNEIQADLIKFMEKVKTINPAMRFLFTVSPVPLMATATNQNVIVATSYSKSVLRAVAGTLAERYKFVDYFPSYEIITTHVNQGMFYNPDKRTIADYGVEHVMSQFFKAHPPPRRAKKRPVEEDDAFDVQCDEELLEAFGEKA